LVRLVMSVSPHKPILQAQRTWLLINIAAIIYLLFFLLAYSPATAHYKTISIALLALNIADITVDYYRNHKLYFAMSNSWDEVAEFWNDMEGREGDVYRRAIIIPAIREAI